MAKRAMVINDLSSFGRCSLTAYIAVLSAMGHTPCPLPTAVLSAQSEFPDYFGMELTDAIPEYKKAWQKNRERFDGISTGYFANSRQLDHAADIINAFRTEGSAVLVDPVMGDNGSLLQIGDNFTPDAKSSYTWEDWVLPDGATSIGGQVDIYVKNTSGCHIYDISAVVADKGDTGIDALPSYTDTKSTVIFNLNGQRVTSPRHGLYIIKGRKMVLR